MNFTELNSGLYQIDHENDRFIGIRIGPSNSQLAKTVFTKQLSPGALFEAPQINPQSRSDWAIIGIANYKESIIAYGPWIENARFGSEIVRNGDNKSLEFVLQASRVCQNLEKDKLLSPRGLFLDGFIGNEAGAILVLPPTIQETILALSDIEVKLQKHEILRLPAFSPAESYAYGWLVLAFRIIIGHFPFSMENGGSEIISLINRGVCRTPRCYIPAISASIEECYVRYTVKHKFPANPLSECALTINLWRELGEFVLGNERTVQNNSAEIAYQRRKSIQKSRRFLSNNGVKIGFIAVIAALVISVPGAIIGNYLRPPRTMGMTGQQVVSNFYECFNSLDNQFMEDASTKTAGQNQKDFVTNIFILDRIRFANEQTPPHLTPAAVKKITDKALLENKIIFGIDQFQITKIETMEQAGFEAYDVVYDLWAPNNNPETSKTKNPDLEKPYIVSHHKERVTVKLEERGNWRIIEIKDL